jgi:DNA-binding NarL/FixJ family response regulator
VAQNAQPKISLIVADDHPIIRKYLKRVLKNYFDIEHFIEANDGSELLGSIDKTVPDLAIIEAFRTIINGNRYHSDVSSGIDQKEFDCFQGDTLTLRESEIVDLIVKGYSSREIADILSISKWTVDRHRANIRKKLGVSNVAGLVHFALKTHGRKNERE